MHAYLTRLEGEREEEISLLLHAAQTTRKLRARHSLLGGTIWMSM